MAGCRLSNAARPIALGLFFSSLLVSASSHESLAQGVAEDLNCSSCVNFGEFSGGSVTNATIANNTIGTRKLGDGAVGTAKISDGAVTPAKLSQEVIDLLSSGLDDAPADGTSYVRRDGEWVEETQVDPGLADAPADGKGYLRLNGEWVEEGRRRTEYSYTVDCAGGTGDFDSLQTAVDSVPDGSDIIMMSECAEDVTISGRHGLSIEGSLGGALNSSTIEVASILQGYLWLNASTSIHIELLDIAGGTEGLILQHGSSAVISNVRISDIESRPLSIEFGSSLVAFYLEITRFGDPVGAPSSWSNGIVLESGSSFTGYIGSVNTGLLGGIDISGGSQAYLLGYGFSSLEGRAPGAGQPPAPAINLTEDSRLVLDSSTANAPLGGGPAASIADSSSLTIRSGSRLYDGESSPAIYAEGGSHVALRQAENVGNVELYTASSLNAANFYTLGSVFAEYGSTAVVQAPRADGTFGGFLGCSAATFNTCVNLGAE